MATNAIVCDDVLYFVDQGETVQGYLGRKPFAGGGSGAKIEHASVILNESDSVKIQNEPIAVYQTAGCAAYYTGRPEVLIVNGQPVLFDVPYEDIKPEWTTSDYFFTNAVYNNPTGRTTRISCYVSSVTATQVTVSANIWIYNSDGTVWQTRGFGSATFEPDDVAKFSCGLCLDITTIIANATSTSTGVCGYVRDLRWERLLKDQADTDTTTSPIFFVGFENGKTIKPTRVDVVQWDGAADTIGGNGRYYTVFMIGDAGYKELQYNLGLAKRYEVMPE